MQIQNYYASLDNPVPVFISQPSTVNVMAITDMQENKNKKSLEIKKFRIVMHKIFQGFISQSLKCQLFTHLRNFLNFRFDVISLYVSALTLHDFSRLLGSYFVIQKNLL